jgi:uncharacterized protein
MIGTALLVALAGFVAWIISTVGGGGGGLLLAPAISYLIGARAVAPVVTLTGMVGEPARIVLFRHDIEWRIVRWYLPGALPASILGGWVFAHARVEWLQLVVGLFLISTVWQYRFGRRKRSFLMRVWWFLPLGIVVAFFDALIGSTGPVLNPFYLNAGAAKEPMIATKSVNSFVTNFAQIGTYTAFGAMTWRYVAFGLVAGAAAALASWVGKAWLERLAQEQWRRIAIAIMVVSGASLIWHQRGEIVEMWRALIG